MYHPVLEQSFEDNHEFVELYNAEDEDVDLSGWTLDDGIKFTFPEETTISAGGFVIVAKNREMLLSEYEIDPAIVFGDYQKQLGNGGDTIVLSDADESLVESVTYDDEAPWPIAADALGAGQRWLAPEILPLEQYQFRGRSLERLSYAHDSILPSNWAASPLTGPSPGQPNSAAADFDSSSLLPVIAETIVVTEDGTENWPIGGDAPAEITLAVATNDAITSIVEPVVEYYIDDVTAVGEPTSIVAMSETDNGMYSAILPGQPENTVVRYRILHTLDGAEIPLSPRPEDPFQWHGYFVEPTVSSDTTRYHLFIPPDAWTRLWDNIIDGRVDNGVPNPTWNDREPAVFAQDGHVYDVQVRYQGSRFNRTKGRDLSSWTAPGPDRPSTVKALSWRIAFPRYKPFDERRVVTLNKLNQGCPGYSAQVGFSLFQAAGVPASNTRYIRFHINGDYYHYMQELEHVDEDLLERYHEEQAKGDEDPDPIGHLFKVRGVNDDVGPYGWGDGRELAEYGGFSPLQRYEATYARNTHDWLGHAELIALIVGLHAARAEGVASLRAYLTQHFDVNNVLNYLAVMNWLGAWDDVFHNYFLYQRRTTGKWMFIPWDMDKNFGDYYNSSTSSIYVGEQDDRSNRDIGGEDNWNRFKDSFFIAYRSEYQDRLRTLVDTVLHESSVIPLIDAVEAQADGSEAQSAPAGRSCNFTNPANNMRDFASERNAYIRGILP